MLARLVIGPLLVAALALAAAPARSAESGLEPRAVLPRQAKPASATDVRRIIVKFREGTSVRGQGADLRAAAGSSLDRLRAFLASSGVPQARLRRLHSRPEHELDAERERGMERSSRQLADLNLYYVLDVPPGASPADLLERLNALPLVEFAEPVTAPPPPPAIAGTATPDLVGLQGYRADPPAGLGVLDPTTVPGGDGAGMTLVDIEYNWIFNHEDLDLPTSAVIDEAHLLDPFPHSEADHGTATLGVIGAVRNGIGMTGLAPGARLLVAPVFTEEFSYNLPRAISLATGRLQPGDVLLIEQQMPVCNAERFGPVEWAQAVWDAIATATALGIIVVEPAGNGAVDLDGPSCEGRFDRTQRDSRAIIVGAGDPSTRARVAPTAHGSRLDVQGWGAAVATAGFGDVFDPGDLRRRYTKNFNGTSSAAAMVAGAVLSLQGALKAENLPVAPPMDMRRALSVTGTAPSGIHQIGPLPNVKAALAWLHQQRGVAPSWQAWESFGGALAVSEPECLSTSLGVQDCWARTIAGTLAWWRHEDGSKAVPVSLGGSLRSAPSCLMASGMLHCFVADPARGIGHTFYRDGKWQRWIKRGASSAVRPSCLSTDGIGIDCIVLVTSGRLRHRGIANGQWNDWVTLTTSPSLRDPPTCFARDSGIDCLAVGFDNRVYALRRDAGGAWSSLQNLNGAVKGRASCVRTDTTPTCFFRGGDRRLKRIIHDGTRWGSWNDLGGSLAGDPSCVLFGELALFCLAPSGNGSLMEWSRTRAGKNGWRNLGGSIAATRPACTPAGENAMDCFAVGRNSQLQHIAYR